MDHWALAFSLLVLTVAIVFYIQKNCAPEVTLGQRILMFYILEITFLPLSLLPLELEPPVPGAASPSDDLSVLWLTYYYLNFINGYLVLPISIGYFLSGHFSRRSRLLDAIWTNVAFYLTTIFLGLAAFGVANYQYGVKVSQVQDFVPKIVNTLCYLVYCALLSYGIWQVPLMYLRSNFYAKIHEKLILFKETTDDYYQLISTLIQLEEVS